ASHSWNTEGNYEIRVKARDENGGESPWSDPLLINILKAPTMDIGLITGGFFKVNAVIKNIGAVDSAEVSWSISLDGGVWIGKETTGTITSLAAGGEDTISSDFILGWGETRVTVRAEITEGSDSRSQRGKLYLFYVQVNPGGV
ncbi:MAG: Zn-dependent exopeptidase M28, partial [Thermoplasmatales archaeon]